MLFDKNWFVLTLISLQYTKWKSFWHHVRPIYYTCSITIIYKDMSLFTWWLWPSERTSFTHTHTRTCTYWVHMLSSVCRMYILYTLYIIICPSWTLECYPQTYSVRYEMKIFVYARAARRGCKQRDYGTCFASLALYNIMQLLYAYVRMIVRESKRVQKSRQSRARATQMTSKRVAHRLPTGLDDGVSSKMLSLGILEKSATRIL